MSTKSESPAKHNLPAQLTPLIGREQEVSTACALIRRPEVRLMTLTGTGGIGKTRLGLEIARTVLPDFSDGVFFTSLASIRNPELVIPTIAQTLGLREAGDWSLKERLKAFLHKKFLLLLIDNFEQVVTAAPELIELLACSSHLKIIVTSRAVLSVYGEYEFPVSPLSLPDLKHFEKGEDISQSAAVALFLQRAQAIKPDFYMTPKNARAIAEICVRLDGLPLALELAAARTKLLPPQALLTRLERRLHLLTSTAQDIPARQRTLRNALAWSYDLLNTQEQGIFRQVSVFIGGFTLDAAQAVCNSGHDGELFVLDNLASLMDKSLLSQIEQEAQEPRFVMLETIREYGLERLIANEEEVIATQHAHATYYLALAEKADSHLPTIKQRMWLQRLEQECDNLRAAFYWLLEQNEVEKALRLATALWRFWWMCGRVIEGKNLLELSLAASQKMQETLTSVRARALSVIGTLAGLQGDFDQAETFCHQSLALSRQLGDRKSIITALWMLGYVAREKGNYTVAEGLAGESLTLSRDDDDAVGTIYSLETLAAVALDRGEYEQACKLIEEILVISRQLDDTWKTASLLWLLATVTLFQGDFTRAQTLLEESLTRSKEINDKRNTAYSLVMLGYVAYFQDQRDRMRILIEEGLALHREVGDRRGIAEALYGLGWSVLDRGDPLAAQGLFEQSLAILRELKRTWFMALCIDGLACAVAAQGQSLWAARLWGAASSLRAAIGATLPPVISALYQPFITAASDEAAFATAWTEGGTMIVETTPIDTLFHSPSSLAPPVPAPLPVKTVYPAGLTTREIEVLRWVAQGLTDIQVAEKLVISPRTVSTHLSSIYNKLGVSTRSAATRFAIENHLV
jgi:predicted ATPase/DNA-binding CsgD family transcriptional regulator